MAMVSLVYMASKTLEGSSMRVNGCGIKTTGSSHMDKERLPKSTQATKANSNMASSMERVWRSGKVPITQATSTLASSLKEKFKALASSSGRKEIDKKYMLENG